MLIEDLIGQSVGVGVQEIQAIRTNCSQFLAESASMPLYKSLPSTYYNFHKVKVRLQKRKDEVSDVFEQAFGQNFANFRQRAVFAYPNAPQVTEGTDSFYIFPVNGYKFLYSKEVTNSSNDYKTVIDTLFEQFEDQTQASDIVTDLLKYTYSSVNLREGIACDSEIIVYGIPFYYAVRTTACEDYHSLLAMAK